MQRTKHIFSVRPQFALTNLVAFKKFTVARIDFTKFKITKIENNKKFRKVYIKCFLFQVFAACIYFPTTEKNI